MPNPNPKEVLVDLRQRLASEINAGLRKTNDTHGVSDTSIIALALVTLALDLDYLTENLHRVGEGV